eukprot:13840862-Alexandrium_andersonii.AAC.1
MPLDGEGECTGLEANRLVCVCARFAGELTCKTARASSRPEGSGLAVGSGSTAFQRATGPRHLPKLKASMI